MHRVFAVLPAAFAIVASIALPAFAHVTANPNEGPAGQFFKTSFRIGHGCDGSPTTTVRVQIPPGVGSVRPQVVPGWEIAIVRGPVEPYEQHGETIIEGVTEVAWAGGSLDDQHMQEFGLSMRLPGTGGEAIYFPVVQECAGGAHRWIEIPETLEGWATSMSRRPTCASSLQTAPARVRSPPRTERARASRWSRSP